MWYARKLSFDVLHWRLTQLLVTALVFFVASSACSQVVPNERRSPSREADARVLRLVLFVRSDSELCARAISVAEEFCKARGGVELTVHDVVADRFALERYWSLVSKFRVRKPVLPAFYACHRLKVGYAENERDASLAELFAIHAYIRLDCQHCRDASAFLKGLVIRWRGVRVVFHDVIGDPAARDEMTAAARRHGVSAASLPGIVMCGRFLSGYKSDATTGRNIEELLWQASIGQPLDSSNDGAATRRRGAGEFTYVSLRRNSAAPWVLAEVAPAEYVGENVELPIPDDATVPITGGPILLPEDTGPGDSSESIYELPAQAPEGIDVPWLGRISVRDWGLPLFTLTIGLIDGFNPCAMWVLVFLLSILANVKDRRRIAVIAGSFVLVSGAAYFAFMAAWLSLFNLIDLARPLQIAVGARIVHRGRQHQRLFRVRAGRHAVNSRSGETEHL